MNEIKDDSDHFCSRAQACFDVHFFFLLQAKMSVTVQLQQGTVEFKLSFWWNHRARLTNNSAGELAVTVDGVDRVLVPGQGLGYTIEHDCSRLFKVLTQN